MDNKRHVGKVNGIEYVFTYENFIDGTIYHEDDAPEMVAFVQNAQNAARVKELKKYLDDTDYVVIKIAEGAANPSEYTDVLAARASAREEINSLEV